MAVVTSPSLEFHLTGGINGQSNNNPFASLGGIMALSKIQEGKMDNLWDPVSSGQQIEGLTEYRWIVLWNTGTEPFNNAHFYFMPKDDNVDIEFSRIAMSQPVEILSTEEERPSEAEIGPEEDVPMPFTKSTDSYETTKSIKSIPSGGKLYICVRRVISANAPSENRAYVLVAESRVTTATAAAEMGRIMEGPV